MSLWPASSSNARLAAPSPHPRAAPTRDSPLCTTVQSLVPGGLAASAPSRLYSARCWAYTNVNLPTRLTAGPPTARARVLLAGLQRYQSASLPGGLVTSPVPLSIDYGETYQQLLVEWAGVNATQVSTRVTGKARVQGARPQCGGLRRQVRDVPALPVAVVRADAEPAGQRRAHPHQAHVLPPAHMDHRRELLMG